MKNFFSVVAGATLLFMSISWFQALCGIINIYTTGWYTVEAGDSKLWFFLVDILENQGIGSPWGDPRAWNIGLGLMFVLFAASMGFFWMVTERKSDR